MQIFGIGVTVCVILSAQMYGWNIHVWDLTRSQAIKGRQVSIAAQTLFLFSSGIAKNSILVSYLRIAPKDSWLRKLTYASIAIVTSLIFIFLIVLWTQCRYVSPGMLACTSCPKLTCSCRPMSAYWTLDGSVKCSNEGPPIL